MVEEESEYIQLSNLFNSIGIIEKGIEKVYHFLLENKRIENLKDVCDQYKLSLKRGYKICSVLSDLELVQIYDRPMKINLTTPIIPAWQKLVNKRIEELKSEYQDEKEKCSSFFDDFLTTYNLKSQDTVQEPVELIIFNIKNIHDLYYPLFTKKECKIALGIRYENPFISYIKTNSLDKIKNDICDFIKSTIEKLKKNIQQITIQVIFNEELIKELLNSKEFLIVKNQLEEFEFKFKSLKVRITKENFSNFSLTDDELIQPSFDPTNKLMGSYISRNDNIYQIFNNKFNEIFNKGISINNFLLNEGINLKIESLTEKQEFALCIL